MTTRRPSRTARRSAFTVVELLVAIAVLAIISVGLSVIFGTVGDAVTDGRRVSELNRAAARIELQIRDDLSGLTRDGFLVIANRYASNDQGQVFSGDNFADAIQPGVRVAPADQLGRARRTDELMFFARGEFQSKRPPLKPGIIASSSEASIYYGIGQRRPINILADDPNNTRNFYFNPSPLDANLRSDRLSRYAHLPGNPEPAGQLPNPNRFASDWSLLRHVTVLAEPQIVRVLPAEAFGRRRTDLADRTLMMDSARQIALQPASRSIFNSLSWTDQTLFAGAPGSVPGDGISRWWFGDIANYGGGGGLTSPADRSLPAWRSSGVVDIAQGDILGIRRQLESLAVFGPPSNYYAPGAVNVLSPRPATFAQSADGFRLQWLDQTASPRPSDGRLLSLTNPLHRLNLRAWALDMLPSLWDGESNPPRKLAGVRYEELPTRLSYEPTRFPSNDFGRLGRAILEANQEMLASSVFVPRCTEFIVEWSYGYVDDTLAQGDPNFKRMLWYGLPRSDRDVNNNGRIDLQDHSATAPIDRAANRYIQRVTEEPRREWIAMIPPDNSLTNPEIVVFGLTNAANTPANVNPVVPWPRFIRITMSLADPDNPTIERTYQFVFSVPGEQG